MSSIALQASSQHCDVVVDNDLRGLDHGPPGILARCPRRSPTGTASQDDLRNIALTPLPRRRGREPAAAPQGGRRCHAYLERESLCGGCAHPGCSSPAHCQRLEGSLPFFLEPPRGVVQSGMWHFLQPHCRARFRSSGWSSGQLSALSLCAWRVSLSQPSSKPHGHRPSPSCGCG